MKSRTLTRAAIIAALLCCLFALAGCDDFNQNGSADIGACMKLPDNQQKPCLDAVSQRNEQRLEQQAVNAYR